MVLAGLTVKIFKSKVLSLCILKKTLLKRLTQTCFLHKFSQIFCFFIAEETLKQHQTIIEKTWQRKD